jgi:hypothetical protein
LREELDKSINKLRNLKIRLPAISYVKSNLIARAFVSSFDHMQVVGRYLRRCFIRHGKIRPLNVSYGQGVPEELWHLDFATLY